jgi:hypothetical protein
LRLQQVADREAVLRRRREIAFDLQRDDGADDGNLVAVLQRPLRDAVDEQGDGGGRVERGDDLHRHQPVAALLIGDLDAGAGRREDLVDQLPDAVVDAPAQGRGAAAVAERPAEPAAEGERAGSGIGAGLERLIISPPDRREGAAVNGQLRARHGGRALIIFDVERAGQAPGGHAMAPAGWIHRNPPAHILRHRIAGGVDGGEEIGGIVGHICLLMALGRESH